MRSAGGSRTPAVVLVLPALALLLAACSAPPAAVSGADGEEPSAKAALFEAKRQVLAAQDQVLSLIPSDNVVSVDKETRAQLLGCGDDYLWPGGARVELEGELNQQGIADSAAERFETGWTVGPSPTASAIGFSLDHDDGRELTAVFSSDGTRFTVTAFSACFPFEPEAGVEY